MAERLPVPRWVAEGRDEAAEWITRGRLILASLADGRRRDEHETLLAVVQADRCFENAQRWLETIGACTRPNSIVEVRR